jgi:ankyrin repeat protein
VTAQLDAFLDAACVPLDRSHTSGDLVRADEILAAHPEVASESIHAAAVLGDDGLVRRFVLADRSSATARGGPREWDPLTHLCFSRYLRLDRSRSDGFVRAATALLDAGASANTGWIEPNHQPVPEWESVLYGAAAVARHAELTRLLLERGADPNDEETPYHSPEGHDNEALVALLDSGKLTDQSLGMMLLRKTDWHDHDGVALLLDRGVDPNRMTRWGKTALHNAIISDNEKAIVELLLDHGADPTILAERPHRGSPIVDPRSAVALAARRGRGDLLELFRARGFPLELSGLDQALGLAALDDGAGLRALVDGRPALLQELRADAGRALAEFAGVGNLAGVRRLLDLGLPVDAPYSGDGYFDIAPDSTALHVAAWRARHPVVGLLIDRGAAIDRLDGRGRTPLELAVRACTDSYWVARRPPDSVALLVPAGAARDRITVPTGYDAIDVLLAP